ncbi:oxidoreductase [Streptomyces sp. P9(2023)]|uniref:oxidoreductase n=1 Tax=Streptomyces sp. P9(2023) TaxID=3064394 RepID=UPI0028F405CB|nr:oxidoreductase [Streptomyces sp. P9(2023)]MDT9687725.1 oxidoreductase [Streptomyces sp. P9(2023)]
MTYPTGPYGYGYPPPPPPPKPGVIPLAPLGLSQILTGAFATIGRYWKPLLGVATAAYGAALLLLAAAVGLAYAAVSDHLPRVFDLPSGQDPSWDDGRPLLIAFVVVSLVAMVGMLLASTVVYAACPAVLQEAVLGRRTTFGVIWRRSWSRVPAVIGTVFLSALLMAVPLVLFTLAMIGFMAALISAAGRASSGSDAAFASPVLATVAFLVALATMPLATWIWVKLSLAPSAAVFEGQGAMASLRRSNELVRASWWRIFGALLVAGILAAVANWMIQQVLSLLLSVPVSFTDTSGFDSTGDVLLAFVPVLAIVVLGSMVGQALCSVFPPLVTGLVYVDQRIRKENLAPTLTQAAGTPPFSR